MKKLLSNCNTADEVIVIKIKGRSAFRKRIVEMGFIKGHKITVIKNAPLKDPIEYQILDYKISLRKSEAELIEVVNLEDYKATKEVPFTDLFLVPKEENCRPNRNRNCEKKKDKKRKFGFWKNNLNTEFDFKNSKQISNEIDVAFVGNPNSGKTSLFNSISNSRARVGNYPGITVESLSSTHTYKDFDFNLTDLPGTYSMSAYSEEEVFVRNHIKSNHPDVIVNVLDSSNLERNLYLTCQLIDMDVKIVIALNMYDELLKSQAVLNYLELARLLGIPIVPTIGSKGTGVNNLLDKIISVFENKDPVSRHIHINYGLDIEKSIVSIQNELYANSTFTNQYSSRYLAIKLIEKDVIFREDILDFENSETIDILVQSEIRRLEQISNEDTETQISDARYGFVSGALKETLKKRKRKISTVTDKIDNIITHKYLGFPIFLLFIWVMFQATFKLGDYPVQLITKGVEYLSAFLSTSMSDSIFKDLLIDGVIGGVGGVIVFLPSILILFFFISLMEDSGYMSRIAFIMDKLMHLIGLHGKSFIPLIMGFGCNVPAIMATRTLENKSDRIFTTLLIPFMSCSAKLPVYLVITGAIFGANSPNIIFGIYLTGIAVSILLALVLNFSIFKKKDTPFVMELPPYRIPTLKSVILHMWARAQQYLKKMSGIILWASLIIWALGYFPTNIEYSQDFDQQIVEINKSENIKSEKDKLIRDIEFIKENEKKSKSYIGQIGKFIEPVMEPLGFDWRMGVSLLSGIAAKEVVVSTMGVLYQTNDLEVDLSNKIKIATHGSGELKGQKVFDVGTTLAFLFFILIYVPCIAVITAVAKETHKKRWAFIMVVYSTAIAWVGAYLINFFV